MIRKITRLLTALAIVVSPLIGNAQISLTNGVPSNSQNFDAMAATQNLPANWRIAGTASPTWASGVATTTQQASSGSPTAGGTYNFGTSTSERAVGAMTSGSFASPNSVLSFYSNGGTTNITSLSVAYDAERYRVNSAAASVQFYYSLDGSTWTSVAAGDIAASSFPTGTNAYTFGAPLTINQTGITISGLSIAPAGTFYLRWNINTTGASSQGIAVDNIAVTATFAAGCTGPTTASTTFGSSNITSSSADLSFTGGNGDNRVVFVTSGSFTAALPAANTTYTANNDFTGTSTAFDGGKTVYNSNGTSVSLTNLSPNTTYNVKVFDYLGTAGAECYNNTALTGSFTTTAGPCVAPTAVSTVAYSGVTGTNINGTITAPGGGASGYAVFYSTSATTPVLANGTVYNAGNTPAGFTFVQSGAGTAFSQGGLTPATTYYFHVFSYNNTSCTGGPAYAAAYTSSQATQSPCVAPNAASNIVFGTVTSSAIPGSFTASAGGADGYTVFVSTNSTAPVLVNGTVYNGGNAPSGYTFVQSSASTSFNASGLTPNTTYYVYVFAYNNVSCSGGPAYSSSISNNVVTPAGPAIPEADGDYRTVGGGTWTNGGGTATWERRTSGSWGTATAPSYSYSSGRIFIRNAVSATGSFASPAISILNGGTLTNTAASTVADLHIYDGGTMQANATLSVQAAGTLEVEDLGTLVINYGAAGNSGIWAGTENFHPNSNLIISNWSGGGTPLLTNIATNTYAGYTAAFGNVQFNVITNPGGNIDILPTSTFTGNIGHGNLRFTALAGSNLIRVSTSGTTTSGIGGNFIMDAAYPAIITMKSSGGLDFTIKGNLQIDGSNFRISGASTGTFNVNVNGNVNITGTSIAEYSTTVGGTSIFALNIGGNLTVASGATFRNAATGNAGQVNFVGTNAQTLDIATGANHANIVFNVNNPTGVQVINNDINMTQLTLTNGILSAGSRAITMVAGATLTGGSATSYVDGKLTWTTSAATAYNFPVGKAGEYYPVTIQPSNATANTFSVVYNKSFRGTPGHSNVNAPLTTVNASEYFDIAHPSGTATATITLPWGTTSSVADPATVVVAHYNGSSWDNLGGTPSGTAVSGTVTVAGVSSFSPFAIGSTTPQPLPVHLLSFTLEKDRNTAKLNWEVTDMDGGETVTVERSSNGRDFTALTTVAAQKKSASYTDMTPANGANQYRLALKSGNGSVSYSKTLTAVFGKEANVAIYPNPVQQNLQIDWSNAEQPATVEIRNAMGQVVYHATFAAQSHADVSVSNLVNGAYFITWKQGDVVKHQQLQVAH